jgi:hypothetical protein
MTHTQPPSLPATILSRLFIALLSIPIAILAGCFALVAMLYYAAFGDSVLDEGPDLSERGPW